MKKIYKVLMILAMMVASLSGFMNVNPVFAAASKDDSFEVKGNSQTIDVDEVTNETTVRFTFKTDHPDLVGLIGGSSIIKFDPDKMDYIPGSIQQPGGMANEGSFTYNGQSSVPGEILMVMSNARGAQNYDLTLKFKNLFKDGDRTPIEVQIIQSNTDSWIIEDTQGNTNFTPANPIITKATISLTPIGVSITGINSIEKGKNSTYAASLTNALDASKGVTWSMTGATDVGTTVDANGKLTVAKNETATSVILTATSKEDVTAKATKTITLTNPPQLSVGISGKDQLIKGTKGNVYVPTVVNATNKAVTWELSGQTSAKTTVDSTGKVNVGIDETATTLTLKATSVEDTTKISTMSIKVIDKTYTIIEVELPKQKIEMEKGTTEDQFDVEAQKNDIATVTIKTNDGKTYTIKVPTLSYESDKDVVGEDGVIQEGKFNLIYQLKLPHILIDEEGNIELTETQTNLIGSDKASIPALIGEDKPTIDIQPNDPTKPNTTNKPGTTDKPNITIKPVQKPIQTSDNSQIGIYTGGLMLSGFMFMAVAIYKRRKGEE